MKNLSTLFFLILIVFNSQFVYSQNDSFTIIYNNVSSKVNLQTQWGYSAWIEIGDEIVLFDAGTNPQILQENLKKLNLNAENVSAIAISHDHGDHTGGLESVLKMVDDGTKVYLPNDYNPKLRSEFKKLDFIVNDKYRQIAERVWITEVFVDNNRGIREQALVLENDDKIIVITGCAHPGITEMCEGIKKRFPDKKLELVTGGFHLMQHSEEQVAQISDKLKLLGFEKVAPSHCTGDNSIAVFSKKWGDDFVQLHLGDTYKF